MALFGIGERKLMGAALVAMGVVPFYFAFHAFRLKRRIEDTPTSKIRSMAIGLVEAKGTVVARETVRSPYTRKPCVFYDYKLERLEVRRVYSPNARRWITTKEWVLVRLESDFRRFFLEDETGRVLVDPEDASVPETQVYEEGVAPRRRHTERLILPGSSVYLMGTAGENPEGGDGGRLMVRKGDIEKDFVISSESQKQLTSGFLFQSLGMILLGLLVMGLGAWMILFS